MSDLGRVVIHLASLSTEQLEADRRRYYAESATWKTRAKLTEDHPNIKTRRARIRIVDQLLKERLAATPTHEGPSEP